MVLACVFGSLVGTTELAGTRQRRYHVCWCSCSSHSFFPRTVSDWNLPPTSISSAPFTRVLPESTRPQPPQPAAGPHLSMNIKIMYIVLTTSAPVFCCFNNTRGTDRDHLLTHISAGLATLCKSPVLDRNLKKKKLSEVSALKSGVGQNLHLVVLQLDTC